MRTLGLGIGSSWSGCVRTARATGTGGAEWKGCVRRSYGTSMHRPNISIARSLLGELLFQYCAGLRLRDSRDGAVAGTRSSVGPRRPARYGGVAGTPAISGGAGRLVSWPL